jgi:hypothetical protein
MHVAEHTSIYLLWTTNIAYKRIKFALHTLTNINKFGFVVVV